MTKEQLTSYIEMGLSQRGIADVENVSQSTVKHYLKKFDLKTPLSGKPEKSETEKNCGKCKQTLSIDMFYNSKERGKTNYCKQCSKIHVIERQQKFKLDCLTYKGGECIMCGYSKYVGALEFHHRDSTDKEFSISEFKLYKFGDDVKKELDKCDVLCSNCHKETHFKLRMGL